MSIDPDRVEHARHFGPHDLTDDELDALIDHERHHPNPAWLDRLIDLRSARIRAHISERAETQRTQAIDMIEAAEQQGMIAPAWCYEQVNPLWVAALSAQHADNFAGVA